MAEYINIRGQSIEVVASDPANPTQGQIWYNSTSNTLKGLGVSSAGTWATSGTMNNGRTNGGSTGTQTAGLFFTGNNPSTGNSNATESYDGSTWTTVPATVGEARYLIAYAGTQTAALAAGGYTTTDVSSVEEYDGATWTTATGLPSVRRYPGGAGTQTAAIAIGGLTAYPGFNYTEEYNGSTWTGGGAYPTTVIGIGAAGTLTAAIASGGANAPLLGGPAFNAANEYNGSAWTSSNNLLNFRYPNDMSGIQTAALAFAGTPGSLSPGNPLAVESYDGTCFSADTNTLASLDQGSGDTTYTFAVSGDSSGNTYNYNGPGTPGILTITAS
jgi:hypothetical protein